MKNHIDQLEAALHGETEHVFDRLDMTIAAAIKEIDVRGKCAVVNIRSKASDLIKTVSLWGLIVGSNDPPVSENQAIIYLIREIV